MSQRRILLYPHPNLRRKSAVVTEFTPDLEQLAQDLLDTMYEFKGIGLSAPQVNVHQRIIVVDATPDHSDPQVLINPKVTLAENPNVYSEGCLSFPGFYEEVKRPHSISVKAQDTKGRDVSIDAEGIKAVCIQHECDHLDGTLFVDYISKLKASRIHKKMLQAKKR